MNSETFIINVAFGCLDPLELWPPSSDDIGTTDVVVPFVMKQELSEGKSVRSVYTSYVWTVQTKRSEVRAENKTKRQ